MLYDPYDVLYTMLLMTITHSFVVLFDKFATTKLNDKTKWFFLHFVGNCYVVYRSLHAVLNFIHDPIHATLSTDNVVDTRIIVLSMHIYHQLLFKLNTEDLYHHIVFVYLGTTLIHFSQIGYLMSIYQLFSSGLPGGLIYLCLVLEHYNIMNKETRLSIASWINLWIRSPGLCICGSVCLLRFLYFPKTINSLVIFILTQFCTIYNGQYYMNQVIRADERDKNRRVK